MRKYERKALMQIFQASRGFLSTFMQIKEAITTRLLKKIKAIILHGKKSFTQNVDKSSK